MSRGIAQKKSEVFSGSDPEIPKEIKGAGEKTAISAIVKEQHVTHGGGTPRNEKLKELIDNVFSLSEKSQPSRILHAGAGVADAASLAAAFYSRNALFEIGIVASELVAWAKGRSDTRVFSEARKLELDELNYHRMQLLSELNKKKGSNLKELIKETNKLFSDIESRSKKGLTSVLGSRAEGIAGSVLAAASSPLYKQFADSVSGWVEGFIRSWPIQFQPYHPEPVIALFDLAVRLGFYVGASSFLAYGVDWLHEKLFRNRSFERRESEKESLKSRADDLLAEI